MDQYWTEQFRARMRDFQETHPLSENELAVSIKIRITSGCFHREHSPHAYAFIDQAMAKVSSSESTIVLEEHESGPELLVILAATTAGVTLAKSVIDLVTAIIKARSEGIQKGDHPHEPIELIVRRIENDHECVEETILRIGHNDPVNPTQIAKALNERVQKYHPKKHRPRT